MMRLFASALLAFAVPADDAAPPDVTGTWLGTSKGGGVTYQVTAARDANGTVRTVWADGAGTTHYRGTLAWDGTTWVETYEKGPNLCTARPWSWRPSPKGFSDPEGNWTLRRPGIDF